eukprot:764056-Hanusia_phi.AAC.3
MTIPASLRGCPSPSTASARSWPQPAALAVPLCVGSGRRVRWSVCYLLGCQNTPIKIINHPASSSRPNALDQVPSPGVALAPSFMPVTFGRSRSWSIIAIHTHTKSYPQLIDFLHHHHEGISQLVLLHAHVAPAVGTVTLEDEDKTHRMTLLSTTFCLNDSSSSRRLSTAFLILSNSPISWLRVLSACHHLTRAVLAGACAPSDRPRLKVSLQLGVILLPHLPDVKTPPGFNFSPQSAIWPVGKHLGIRPLSV